MIELLILALGVSMDAAAVSAAKAVSAGQWRGSLIFRIAAFFGVFQSAMAFAGWVGGMGLNRVVAAWDHWIAFLLLAFVGTRMIVSAGKTEATPTPVTTTSLIVLSFATSIDSFAVGLTLPILPVEPLVAVTIIGVVTFAVSLLAGSIWQRLGVKFGKRAGMAGGVVLIGIGTYILISHLSA